MDWDRLADKAQEVVQKRGGMRSVGEDAQELEQIVEGEGTLSEKLSAAAKAIKEPGAHHDEPQQGDPASGSATTPTEEGSV